MYSVRLLLASLSLILLVRFHDVGAIRGGLDAKFGEFSYTVAVLRNGELVCSGGIIDKKNVLTAASCLFDPQGQEFSEVPLQVVIGTTNYKEVKSPALVVEVEKYYVPKIYTHKVVGYARNGNIAVLRLNVEPTKSSPVWTKLILSGPKSYERQEATVTGYGLNWAYLNPEKSGSSLLLKNTLAGGYASGKLRSAKTLILPLDKCQVFDQIFNDHYICARVEQHFPDIPEGTCYGDTGAPLVKDGNTVIGVLASGSKGDCNESAHPGMYTKVAPYWTEFIDKAMHDKKDPKIHVVVLPLKSKVKKRKNH